MLTDWTCEDEGIDAETKTVRAWAQCLEKVFFDLSYIIFKFDSFIIFFSI